MTTTLVLVGPHGSGKTTLGRRVAAALGWPFDAEIGEELRREVLASDPDGHAFRPQPDFDLEVFARELARDAASVGPRVVETWHPGNLAFAVERSETVAREWGARLRAAARSAGGVLVQPLMIGRDAAAARRSEPGPADVDELFLRVGARAAEVAREWELRVAPTLWTDRCTVEEAVAVIVGRTLEAVARSP